MLRATISSIVAMLFICSQAPIYAKSTATTRERWWSQCNEGLRLSCRRLRGRQEIFEYLFAWTRPEDIQATSRTPVAGPCCDAAMTGVGQKRGFDRAQSSSGLPRRTDIIRPPRQVRLVPIVLKKSFSGEERKFLKTADTFRTPTSFHTKTTTGLRIGHRGLCSSSGV
jgi:hypothetical protein